jgi:aminoglycoside phosphotransferase family enzyme
VVILTGRFAYKIKKPVNLGFLDFSTLERRRKYCEEELRLNRRLAPSIYLDVVPITGSADAPRLGGAGEPIEFAVRMRQFPQDALLSRVLAEGRLLPQHVDRLAREVAEFHARTAVAPADSLFGMPEQIEQPVLENYSRLFDAQLDSDEHARIEKLRVWSCREFDRLRDKISARRRAGFVRECHGDMHLGNMILDGDDVMLFDCIEFNEHLRWIDVLSEVAFCAMDLEDRGRADFSHRFLNSYLEITGDYDGLVVLPFYLAYRALVRAKVARLRAGQPGVGADELRKLQAEVHGYLMLAELYTQPPRPFLVVTHGYSGSGKTTGTQSVIETLGVIRPVRCRAETSCRSQRAGSHEIRSRRTSVFG